MSHNAVNDVHPQVRQEGGEEANVFFVGSRVAVYMGVWRRVRRLFRRLFRRYYPDRSGQRRFVLVSLTDGRNRTRGGRL